VNLLDASESRTGWASNIELAIRLGYQLTNGIEVHGGYQALFLAGLALAPEQLDPALHQDVRQSSITPGRTGQDMNLSGNLLYHGPSVGLTLRW
jgi:hypothetical protein